MQPTSSFIAGKAGRAFGLLVTLCLLATGLLTACGSANTPVATNQPTPATTVTVAITVEPTSTLAPPTATLVPPTATTAPSPTPEPPQANALVMGDQANPWLAISRYSATPNTKLVEVNITPTFKSQLDNLLVVAPELSALTGSNGLYLLTFGGVKGIPVYSKGELLPILRNPANGQFIKIARLNGLSVVTLPAIANPIGIAFTVLSILGSIAYTDSMDSQLETLNRNVQEIKEFLERKEVANTKVNVGYLDDAHKLLAEQNLTPENIAIIKTQMETIERESRQTMELSKGYIEQDFKTYQDTRIDKGFLTGTRDEKKIDDFGTLIDRHSFYANLYYNALLARSVAAQLWCAIPDGYNIGLTRLEEVQQGFISWRDYQNNFFDLVTKRLPEMDGVLTDNKKQDNYRDTAVTGKTNVAQRYKEVDAQLTAIVKTTKDQMQAAQLPTDIVVELDGQGKLVKVSRVVPVS